MSEQPLNPNAANDPKFTALLIIDMQKGVVAKAHARDAVVTNINTLIQSARKNGSPVIWVQHSSDDLKEGTEAWEYISELKREPNELLIPKKYGDSFEATPLESELKRLGVKKLVVVGAQTDACIRATLHGAFVRGYDTTLVSDAHTTEDLTAYGLPSPEQIINFTNIYWSWQAAPGRQGVVLKTSDVKFDR